jgi:hypothetical protein
MVFVAEDDHGESFGFASVTHETHFTSQRQASVGELSGASGNWIEPGHDLYTDCLLI